MLDAKDPAEVITLTFDFSALTGAVQSATTEIDVSIGNDAAAASMLSGAPQISGAKVLQQVINGVSGCTYHVRAAATTIDGDVFVLAASLPVTRF